MGMNLGKSHKSAEKIRLSFCIRPRPSSLFDPQPNTHHLFFRLPSVIAACDNLR